VPVRSRDQIVRRINAGILEQRRRQRRPPLAIEPKAIRRLSILDSHLPTVPGSWDA
jgi:hypothetical protein